MYTLVLLSALLLGNGGGVDSYPLQDRVDLIEMNEVYELTSGGYKDRYLQLVFYRYDEEVSDYVAIDYETLKTYEWETEIDGPSRYVLKTSKPYTIIERQDGWEFRFKGTVAKIETSQEGVFQFTRISFDEVDRIVTTPHITNLKTVGYDSYEVNYKKYYSRNLPGLQNPYGPLASQVMTFMEGFTD